MIEVELIYIPKDDKIFHQHLNIFETAKVIDAIKASNIESIYPEVINLSVGIFSKIVSLDTVLKDGDRIEIYRSLLIDPKEKRRRQAKKMPKS